MKKNGDLDVNQVPVGIAFKSVPTEPLPKVPFTFTNEDVCRLLPLIKTNT